MRDLGIADAKVVLVDGPLEDVGESEVGGDRSFVSVEAAGSELARISGSLEKATSASTEPVVLYG
jgi:hypothetical protein